MSNRVKMSKLLQALRARKAASNKTVEGDSVTVKQEGDLDSTLELEEKLRNLKLEDREVDTGILNQDDKEEVNDNDNEEKKDIQEYEDILKVNDLNHGEDINLKKEKETRKFLDDCIKMKNDNQEKMQKVLKVKEKETLEDEETRLRLMEELRQAREKLRRIKNHREIQKELYDGRNKDDSSQSFQDLREKYVRSVQYSTVYYSTV